MKANQTYFYRNRGPWDWRVEFILQSWSGLWKSDTPLLSKVSISALILSQRMFGSFQMWTNVDFRESKDVVHHSTKMKKWGYTFYRSEKDFYLNDDGHGIRLEGAEYFWPISLIAFPFKPAAGVIDASTSRARYEMPMAGIMCDCQAVLEHPRGYIDIKTPWLNGRFTLTDSSNKILETRLKIR